jgi:lipopolysaccharide/colanic/teichoic acid biosynthesis glycosyltransferase
MTHAVSKRLFDVVAATLLLLVAIPTIVICTVGTAIALRSWPFFTQERVGRNGRRFRFVKLRTLPPHAPKYASKYELVDLHIPRFSLALRTLHLDELPQLFLVLFGKMSLVGPRPEMPHLSEHYDSEFVRQRTSVRPGCTGLWQVSEHCEQMIYEHPEYDAYYLRNRTLRLDLWIMMRTVRMNLPFGNQRLASLPTLPAWVSVERARPLPSTRPAAELRPVGVHRQQDRPAEPRRPAPEILHLVEPRRPAPDVLQLERAMQVVES